MRDHASPLSPVLRRPPEIAPGAIIANFRIEALIGTGGMGTVYRALDTVLGRTVALKLLSPTLAERPDALARFSQEAKNASWVNHDNVVQIYSFGIDAGVPYIAMEYLRGETLADRLRRGAMSVEAAVDIALPLCSGVHAAHTKDILHRDLKPGNVFLARRATGEVPKLLDFGISKLQSGRQDGQEDYLDLTADNVVVGTELYMAPERAYKQAVDERSDQYSLGVMLYQCVAGRHPHEGKSRFRLFEDARLGRFEPLSRFVPEVDSGFEAIVTRAMSARPADRFPSMRELGRALLPFASTRARGQWTEHYEAPDLRVTTTGSIKPQIAPETRDASQAATHWEGVREEGPSPSAEKTRAADLQAPTVAAGTFALELPSGGAGAQPGETRTHMAERPASPDATVNTQTLAAVARDRPLASWRLFAFGASAVVLGAILFWVLGARQKTEQPRPTLAGAATEEQPGTETQPGTEAEIGTQAQPETQAQLAASSQAVPELKTPLPTPSSPEPDSSDPESVATKERKPAVPTNKPPAKKPTERAQKKRIFYTPEGVPVI